ncbi:hypothetical protein KY290_021268 [Solanum tuberosum]|uniref:Uncharacterized protein n=1 Tax=Solanum tuberosum TaxID=4113 RepID=A0ABQ7V124_SOLTU|nr:hypothetical protein KY285_020190 [Solanum tuberosum]KAH0757775.1 hypothetical protein KY290_021268 [Solanum tuberosum]
MKMLFYNSAMIVQIAVATTPPTPKDCGSPDCPPVTSPRVQISDRRYLAYKEGSVANEKEKHIIIVHGFDSSKDLMLPISDV